MSEHLSQSRTQSTKLLESFCSFAEKLVYFSKDFDQNRNAVWDFKRNIIFNLHSRAAIEELQKDLFQDAAPMSSSSDVKASSSTQDTSPKKSKVKSSKELPKQFEKRESQKSLTARPQVQKHFEHEDTGLISSRTPQSNNNSPPWTKMETSEEFLAEIRASIHLDCDKIMAFMPYFGHVRTFSQPQESVFYAVCFGFFERYLQNKIEQPRISLIQVLKTKLNGIDSDIETLASYLDKQLVPLLQGLNSNDGEEEEEDVVQRFYEDLKANNNLYNSCILIFKKIVFKILEKRGLDTSYRKNTVRWMNDFSNSEQPFYDSIAELFDSTIRVFVLNFSKLVEKAFGTGETSQLITFLNSKPSKKDLTIFLDKSSNYTYLLYHSKEAVENDSTTQISPSRRSKQRSLSPNIKHEPRFSEGISYPSPLTVRNEDKRSIFPITENQENKETNIQKNLSVQKTKKITNETKPNFYNTMGNTYSRPLEQNRQSQKKKFETKSSIEKEESGVKTQVVRSTSPILHDNNIAKPLPKEKEKEKKEKEKTSEPPAATDYMNFKDTASLVDKIMDEINLKVKTGKFDKDQFKEEKTPENKAKDLKERGDKMEYDNKQPEKFAKVEENRPRAISEKFSSHLSPVPTKGFPTFDFKVEKQIVLPSHLKAKFGIINKDITQHNQECDPIISTRVENVDEKSPAQRTSAKMSESLMQIYQTIMQKGEKMKSHRVTIGTPLQMDN